LEANNFGNPNWIPINPVTFFGCQLFWFLYLEANNSSYPKWYQSIWQPYLDANYSSISIWKQIILVIPNGYQSIQQPYLDANYYGVSIWKLIILVTLNLSIWKPYSNANYSGISIWKPIALIGIISRSKVTKVTSITICFKNNNKNIIIKVLSTYLTLLSQPFLYHHNQKYSKCKILISKVSFSTFNQFLSYIQRDFIIMILSFVQFKFDSSIIHLLILVYLAKLPSLKECMSLAQISLESLYSYSFSIN
jgi:hypothetical protein